MNQVFFLNRRYGSQWASALTVGVLVAGPAVAGDTEELGTCLEQVYEIKHTSDFVKVEYLTVTHDGDPSFEIEARDAKGVEWEFMCEAGDGEIYEVEQEAESADDSRFKQNVKVSEQQATKMATGLYPGTVEEVEYEIEANGDSTYEIDVVDDHDIEWKVEVDAATGDIIETHIEKWEIGEESDEAASK